MKNSVSVPKVKSIHRSKKLKFVTKSKKDNHPCRGVQIPRGKRSWWRTQVDKNSCNTRKLNKMKFNPPHLTLRCIQDTPSVLVSSMNRSTFWRLAGSW